MKHLKIKIEKKEFDSEIILKDIDFVLNKTDKIAIVGSNWAGKSTLLKIISWEIKNFEGSISNIWNLTIWYLKQIHIDNKEKTIQEELEDAFPEILKLEEEINILEKNMQENSEDLEIIEKYTSLLEKLNVLTDNDYKNQIHSVSNGIWILHLLPKKLSEISWWERTKVALAKVLLEKPDILFLDEPTNFIDMTSVEWLESYLQNKWKSWYVIISHDREFLDKTCDKTYEVQIARWITFYHTNYTNYLQERDKIEKRKIETYKREEEYLDKQKKLINRFRAGSRAWWAKSREKSLEKRETINPPYISQKPKFIWNYTWETPEKVLSFKECFIGRTDALFFIRELYLYKWQRIWIVWENWVWKSTFIKSILGKINFLDWYFSRWKWLQIAYYSQMHEELDWEKTIRENFNKNWLNFAEQQFIALLKNYLFEKEDLDKKVKDLSWWQKSKLLFAILWQKEYNLLILDEPTNHLDYDTREALEESLKKFEGAILFISHDRYFVNKLSTNIWFIENEELSISYWNYEDYRFKQNHNIDMDMNLWDEEAELNLVLQEKLWEREFKKLKDRFWKKKKRRK